MLAAYVVGARSQQLDSRPMDPSSTLPAATADLMDLAAGGQRDAWAPAGRPGLVLLDVDGTLMGPEGVVSPAVVAAVQDLVSDGVHVGFATGRNVDGVRGAFEQLQIAGPHVVLNGAQVRQGGRSVRTWPLSDQQREDVLTLCAEGGFYAELYTDDGFLVTAMDQRYRPHWDEVIGQPIGAIADHPDLVGQTIKATIVTLDPADTDRVIAAIRRLGMNAGAATSPVTPDFTYVNITNPDADKGTAVVAAAESLGLGADAVVAVGDGHNDLPMLAVVGTAIAMGDAPQDVKDRAHHVVPGVEEDGAAVALRAVRAWLQAQR